MFCAFSGFFFNFFFRGYGYCFFSFFSGFFITEAIAYIINFVSLCNSLKVFYRICFFWLLCCFFRNYFNNFCFIFSRFIGDFCNSIFLSYASSLAIPRVGEVLRCGVLSKYENISFTRLVGSVVSERVVDMSMVFLFSLVTMLTQIPVFLDFFDKTGLNLGGFLSSLTSTGYWVTGICAVSALGLVWLLMKKLKIFSRTKEKLSKLMEGMMSVARLKNPWLFLLYSVGIWLSYYLHFYIAFYCFEYTAGLGPVAALVAFVVGCFAVLVPTPNGAGPWHFVVKTVLVLYGVQDNDAAVFALIVHTLQTMLTVVLGLYALAALAMTRMRKKAPSPTLPSMGGSI